MPVLGRETYCPVEAMARAYRRTIMPTRILLADDNGMAREMIRRVITQRPDWEIMAEAKDGAEAVEKAKAECPDLAILDIQMPRLNGIEAAKRIMEWCPAAIVLTDSLHDIKPLLGALEEVGVSGFVPKERLGVDLVPAIETVLEGGKWFKLRGSTSA